MKLFLFFINTFLFLSASFSQSATNDSTTGLQVKNALQLYDRFTDGNAAIYNGTQYIYYTFTM